MGLDNRFGKFGLREFWLKYAAVEKDNYQEAGGYGYIGDVEDGPGSIGLSENREIPEINLDEIHHSPMKERRIAENLAIKSSVDEVADCTCKNKCQSQTKKKPVVPVSEDIIKNNYGSGNRKKGEEHFRSYVETECHAGIFDKSDFHELTEYGFGRTVRHTLIVDTQSRYPNPFHQQLRYLVEYDDE